MCRVKAAVRAVGGPEEDADSCMLVGISTSSPWGGSPAGHFWLSQAGHSGRYFNERFADVDPHVLTYFTILVTALKRTQHVVDQEGDAKG